MLSVAEAPLSSLIVLLVLPLCAVPVRMLAAWPPEAVRSCFPVVLAVLWLAPVFVSFQSMFGTVSGTVWILMNWSHHSAPAASMQVTTMLSPFISAAERLIFTLVPDGVFVGKVAKLAKAPPSMETLKSPEASVGELFKSFV